MRMEFAVAAALWKGKGKERVPDAFRRWQRRRVFARENPGTQTGAHDAGIDQVGAHARLGDFSSINTHQHFKASLADSVRTPVGGITACNTRGDEDRAASRRCAQQRIHCPDQAPISGQIEIDYFAPGRGIDMAEGRERTKFGGITDQNVKPSVALEECRRKLVYLDEVAQIEGHEGSAAAGCANPVVDLFQSADRACRQYNMRALARKTLGNRCADAARSTRNQRDVAYEPPGAGSAVRIPVHQLVAMTASGCRGVIAGPASRRGC